MKAEDSRMMAILYAPADYAHVSHLPELFQVSGIRQDTLLNFLLLRRAKLCDLPNGWQPDDDTLSLLLTHWHRVPLTAHLVGGYLLRSRLPAQGTALMSDPRLLEFISLPLLHQVNPDDIIGSVDTFSCGSAFILGQFPELPTALRQRLMLHFPYGMSPAQFPAPKTLNHINLLRMALTYAHRYN